MKKIIKLKESDLFNIVKKVLVEQSSTFGVAGTGFPNYATTNEININPKNLKLGDGGRKHPEQIKDVNILQQFLISKGFLKTETGKPTGYFGPRTNQALQTYLSKNNVKKNTKKQDNSFKDLKVSNQVKKQLSYMSSNNLLSDDRFTILDDKNSQVHAFLPGYKFYRTYYVITGKNRGDKLKTRTVTDWVKDNWKKVFSKLTNKGFQETANYIDSCYFGQREWLIKNTPSGVFKRAGVVQNWFTDKIVTTFIEEDYGKRFITWETCEGNTIPFGFHGTQNVERTNVLNAEDIQKQSCSRRKMSFGCINFNEADVLNVDKFITAGQLTIWLPDMTDDIVEIPQNCL